MDMTEPRPSNEAIKVALETLVDMIGITKTYAILAEVTGHNYRPPGHQGRCPQCGAEGDGTAWDS